MSTRRGLTIIELVATMAVGSVLLGLAIALLCALMHAGSTAREQMEQHVAISRLADQFRRDVRAAERLAALPAAGQKSPQGWQLQLDDGRVVQYRPEPGHLLRSEIADGKPQQQERYRLPGGTAVSVQPRETTSGIVSLRIASAGKSSDGPGFATLEIEATLAKDRRFARSPSP